MLKFESMVREERLSFDLNNLKSKQQGHARLETMTRNKKQNKHQDPGKQFFPTY